MASSANSRSVASSWRQARNASRSPLLRAGASRVVLPEDESTGRASALFRCLEPLTQEPTIDRDGRPIHVSSDGRQKEHDEVGDILRTARSAKRDCAESRLADRAVLRISPT